MDFEIYPMPAFVTLRVTDVEAVTRWYERALGFRTVFRGSAVGGQPALVHLRRRKYQDVLVTPGSEPSSDPAGATLTVTFSADGEVDSLASQARAVDAVGKASIAGPIDTPWNTRDLRVTDPAGQELVFTSRQPNPDPEQAARLRAMLDAAHVPAPAVHVPRRTRLCLRRAKTVIGVPGRGGVHPDSLQSAGGGSTHTPTSSRWVVRRTASGRSVPNAAIMFSRGSERSRITTALFAGWAATMGASCASTAALSRAGATQRSFRAQ